MKKKRNLLTIISSILGIFVICGLFCCSFFIGSYKIVTQSKAEDTYNVSFTNTSSLSYLNYENVGAQGFVANGYTTRFSCDVSTTITQVINGASIYYVPSVTLNVSTFEVYDENDNIYQFNIFTNSSYTSSDLTFNNMVLVNSGLQELQPTDVQTKIQIYGNPYSNRTNNHRFYIGLGVHLSTYYNNGVVSECDYNQNLECYSDFNLPSGISMGDYLGTAYSSTVGGLTWHLFYNQNNLPIDSTLSYDEGYTQGYSSGYANGSLDGYNQGYSQGVSDTQQVSYDDGYEAGVASQQSLIQDAHDSGYNEGFNDGFSADTTAVTIFSGILQVALVPINFFLAIFNFEILGINLSAFIKALFTVVITLIVIRTVLGGGSNDN